MLTYSLTKLSRERSFVMADEGPRQHQQQQNRSFTSFFIKDILNTPSSTSRPNRSRPADLGHMVVSPLASPPVIINPGRPMVNPQFISRRPLHQGQNSGDKTTNGSPLDALFKMTNKTFEGLDSRNVVNTSEITKREQYQMFGSKTQTSKRRRKSRTAFTNQQIYELEKRFLYQKYLTPADRDEIAQSLGLTNAQVITWFQNRRAKLKRDLEELKADVTHNTHLSGENSDNVKEKSDINSTRNTTTESENEEFCDGMDTEDIEVVGSDSSDVEMNSKT